MKVSVVYIILVFFVGMGIAGCGSSRQVLQPAYKEKLTGRQTLGILPLGADLMDLGSTAAPTPLNRRGQSLFYRLFGLALSDLSYLTVSEAGHDYEAEEAAFAYRRFALSSTDTVEVPVPVKGPVSIDGRNPAFLLLIDDLNIAFGADEGREALGALVTSQLVVSARCEYLLWDNRTQQVVGYGRVKEAAPTEPGANVHGPIALLFERISIAIIRKSPFVLVGEER